MTATYLRMMGSFANKVRLLLPLALAGLAFTLAACGAQRDASVDQGVIAQSAVHVRITLTTYTKFPKRHLTRYTLGCRPTAGTLPSADRVCADIARHPVAMLDPPRARTTCSPPAGSSELNVVADAHGSRTTFGGVPDCDWPGGVGLAVYYAAIKRDARALGLIERRLHCDEDPKLLATPTPWPRVTACLHSK